MSVKSRKDEIRVLNLSRLKQEIKISAKCKHYNVLKMLLKLIKFYKPKNILSFMPLSYEPDVCKIRKKIVKDSQIFMPFMVGLSLEMVKYRSPFYMSKFKLREPVNRQRFKNGLDMAIVPVIGVDGGLSRIGHGKGFYDRFFQELPCCPRVVIFVQIMDLFTNEKVAQKHDISCDIYLTPKKNYIKRGKNDRDFSRLRNWCGGSWCRISCGKKDK